MAYGRLLSVLRSGLDGRDVVTLPDGSRDQYYEVSEGSGRHITERSAFVDRLAREGARSFKLRPTAVEPGGQAVNTARQVDALGLTVRLYGHLDAPEFEPFPFETTSMGAPATVHVLSFAADDLMFAVESPDIADWTLETLFEALPSGPDEWLTDEVVVVQNWVGFPGMTDALTRLAEVDLSDATVVFDPGDVTGATASALRDLCEALRAVAGAADLVVTANDRELARFADVVGGGTDTNREVRLRESLDADAVVLHHEPRATVAADGTTTVENLDAPEITRRTGAGDRFDGGLAVGLAAGLPWESTLALGNACASYFVERGDTPTRQDLVTYLTSRAGDE